MKGLKVYCADVGSIKTGKFGWAGSENSYGSDIEQFAQRITEELRQGLPVAVGFECPLFVPVKDEPARLLEARKIDGSRPWSAGAGTASLAAGLVEVIWTLRAVKQGISGQCQAYLDWAQFQAAGKGLFLWEAFVSGKAKGKDHIQDAAKAIRAFCLALPDPRNNNTIHEDNVFSLAGAALLWSGWSEDTGILKTPCLVIKA
jgi:hypothetical protein